MFNIQAINVAEWTPAVLITIWAVAQALLFEYVPYVSDWYGKLEKRWKRFVQAAGLLVVSLIVFGLACGNVIGGIDCDQAGIINVLMVWIWSLMANQTTHLIAKKDG